jgi:isoleucyl-tRNA synthetase
MHSIDQYILLRTAEFSRELRRWYEEFQFHKVYQQLVAFSVVDLSAVYFDVLKDRLYTSAPNSVARRSAQTAIWRIAEALVRLVAPVMSFTADEVWRYLPNVPGRPASVHLETFWNESELAPADTQHLKLRQEWESLLKVRVEVLKALESAREGKEIGSGLEAQVTLEAPDAVYPVLDKYRNELRYIFIVSKVELLKTAATNGSDGLKISVTRAPGQKCERCWNYSTHVGENHNYPMVCERCSAVLEEIEREQS